MLSAGLRYADAAPIYWRAGWPGVLPLPYLRKRYPPEGWTGRLAPYPDVATVQGWCRQDRGRGNLALRLPPDVLGIDVDAYGRHGGAASLARLVDECGPLPATWSSTSRDDGSRILLFRVPAGVRWSERRAGPGVELVHAGHRYAVVWPSIHPGGRPYRWFDPDGREVGSGGVPRVADLALLPAAWVRRLSEPPPRRGRPGGAHPAGASGGGVRSPSAVAASALRAAVSTLRRMGEGSGRNNALNREAYGLGGFVAVGLLEEETVRAELLAASHANGYVAKRGERKARATIDSGLRAGAAAPRRVGAAGPTTTDHAAGRPARQHERHEGATP